jgi:hypothetical protein
VEYAAVGFGGAPGYVGVSFNDQYAYIKPAEGLGRGAAHDTRADNDDVVYDSITFFALLWHNKNVR